MSRGPGRWQRQLLDALDRAGRLCYVPVADAGLAAVGRSMTGAEYRSLIRAAWLLERRGALHLGKPLGSDYTGRPNLRLLAWRCANCSHAATSEHIPALPCFYCKTPTTRRNYGDHPDCGEHNTPVPPCAGCGDPATLFDSGGDAVCANCVRAALQSLPEAARRVAESMVLR